MLTNDFRIARVQKTLRWFEEDIPLLDMRVKELSAERQESARRFAAAVIEQTRAELEMLLQQRRDDRHRPDEFVRHKVLDLVGDLALLGKQILGKVVADRAGHAMHTALVSHILRDKTLWEEVTVSEAAAPSAHASRAHVTAGSPI